MSFDHDHWKVLTWRHWLTFAPVIDFHFNISLRWGGKLEIWRLTFNFLFPSQLNLKFGNSFSDLKNKCKHTFFFFFFCSPVFLRPRCDVRLLVHHKSYEWSEKMCRAHTYTTRGYNRSSFDVCFLPVWTLQGSCMSACHFLWKSTFLFIHVVCVLINIKGQLRARWAKRWQSDRTVL